MNYKTKLKEGFTRHIDVVLVQSLAMEQGITGTVRFPLEIVQYQSSQQGQGRIGMFVHQRFGTIQDISQGGLVTASGESQQQEQ